MGSYIRGYCAPKRKPHLLPALCALLRTAGHADGSPNPSNSNQGWMGEVAWVAKPGMQPQVATAAQPDAADAGLGALPGGRGSQSHSSAGCCRWLLIAAAV